MPSAAAPVTFDSRVCPIPGKPATAEEEKAQRARYPSYRKAKTIYRHASPEGLGTLDGLEVRPAHLHWEL